MWDFPGQGIEPVSPALAGGFLTTAPTGKSPHAINFKMGFWNQFSSRKKIVKVFLVEAENSFSVAETNRY